MTVAAVPTAAAVVVAISKKKGKAMTGIFSKLRTIGLGETHDLLDKVIDLNSPSALRQYVRDLEEALDQLRGEAAVAAATVHTTKREIDDLNAKIETSRITATKLKNNGHPDQALEKAKEIVRLQNEVTNKQALLISETETSNKMDISVANITSKHAEMLSKVRELEALNQSSKAQTHAATALEHAGRLVGSGADISVDDVEGRMRAQNDIATEKLNRAMGAVTTSEDPETTAAAEDLLKNM